MAVVSRLVDLGDGSHVLVHRHSDPLRQFPRQFNREPSIQRLVKFSLRRGRGVLLAVLVLFGIMVLPLLADLRHAYTPTHDANDADGGLEPLKSGRSWNPSANGVLIPLSVNVAPMLPDRPLPAEV